MTDARGGSRAPGAAPAWREETTRGQRYLFCHALSEMAWLRHAFSFRIDAEGRELNLALHAGGNAAEALAGRARFLAGLGLEPGALVAGEQVHGTRVALVGAAERGAGALARETALPATDGLATAVPGLALAVFHADCAPLLLADPATRSVAAVHAGWRGAVTGIAAKAVEALARLGAAPAGLVAAIGPSIGPCCYRVGAEVTSLVPAEARDVLIARDGGVHLDLPGLNAWWLRRAGVPGARIHIVPRCTCCGAPVFHSHRRDGKGAGRMMAVIARIR